MEEIDMSKEGHDVAKHGFRRMDFGPDEKENHFIRDAYVKGAKPSDSEKTAVHGVAKHMQTSKFFSEKGGKK
jgi:hypothetical protein